MKSHEVRNLPPDTPALPAMPLAPGNAKAAEPVPARVKAVGVIPWLDPARAKWTKAEVAKLDRR
jgi:hypothetical protein